MPRTIRLLNRTVRLLNLRGYELQTLACGSAPESPNSTKDLLWRNIGANDLNDHISFICILLEFLYPDIAFGGIKWDEETSPLIDVEWLCVAVLGLGITSAMRLTSANVPPPEKVVRIKAGVHNGKFFISSTDRLSDMDFAKGFPNINDLKEFSPVGAEANSIGLQIAGRVATLGNGEVAICAPHDNLGGVTFKCRFPLHFQKSGEKSST